MSEAEFKPGDRVRRRNGSYTFPGVVLAAFQTTQGRWLYAVEHVLEVGLVHIFRGGDLEVRA